MAPVIASACSVVLIVAAALKLSDRTGAAVAMSTYGIDGVAARAAVWSLIALELSLAAALLAGLTAGAIAAAAMFGAFAIAQLVALATGRGGMPCGCLGATGRLSVLSVLRAVAMAAACGWLALAGFAVPGWALTAACLAVATGSVLLLSRRPPAGALDIEGEGPEIGSVTALADWLPEPDGRLRLAVFTAAGCRLCRVLGPAMERIVAEDRVQLRTFEAEREREVWEAVDVPGAPYAIVVAADGRVVAKGTVNTEQQLRGVVTDAHARAGLPLSAGSGSDSRRDFLGKAAGAATAVAAGSAISALVEPGEAQAFHFCGHIYTTDGCPHPTGLPRIDSRGLPLRARDGRQVDDLGRLIDATGLPIDETGRPLIDGDGRRLPPAPRSSVCKQVGRRYGLRTRVDGSWYRCCGGHVRKLIDCCAAHGRRINGDRALSGYCYHGRKVFCVMFYDTRVKC